MESPQQSLRAFLMVTCDARVQGGNYEQPMVTGSSAGGIWRRSSRNCTTTRKSLATTSASGRFEVTILVESILYFSTDQ